MRVLFLTGSLIRGILVFLKPDAINPRPSAKCPCPDMRMVHATYFNCSETNVFDYCGALI